MLEGNHMQCSRCTAMLTASCHPRPDLCSVSFRFRAISDVFALGCPVCMRDPHDCSVCLNDEKGKQLVRVTDRRTIEMTPSTQQNMKLDNIDLVKVSICWVSLKCECWCPKPQYLGVWLELETEERADIRQDSRGRLIQSDCCLQRTRLGCRYTQGWRYQGQCQRCSSRSKETLKGADDSSTLLANF